jgi:two-component system invasion response regulator UvrY
MSDKQPIRVAYADDHDLVRMGISAIVNSFDGIELFLQARNGKELIKKIEQLDTLPDICMLDINMPVMNGFDTQLALKKKWPGIKTLIVTVYDLELYITRMILNGANGYILKGSDPKELERALQAVHYNGYYYSEAISGHFFKSILNKEKRIPELTSIEIEVLRHTCSDLSYAEIAVLMHTSVRSIEGHKEKLFEKLEVSSRAGMVIRAIEMGYVTVEINSSQT